MRDVEDTYHVASAETAASGSRLVCLLAGMMLGAIVASLWWLSFSFVLH